MYCSITNVQLPLKLEPGFSLQLISDYINRAIINSVEANTAGRNVDVYERILEKRYHRWLQDWHRSGIFQGNFIF